MAKRIVPDIPGGRIRGNYTTRTVTERNFHWDDRLRLFLEADEPRLLDKETLKLYHRLVESGATVQGPIPLPVILRETSQASKSPPLRIHRRLFRILSPTEKTVLLLQRLALAGSINASVQVEGDEET